MLKRFLFIQTATTPNANAMKFQPGKEVAGEATMDFSSIRYTDSSPLALLLLVNYSKLILYYSKLTVLLEYY